jgi:rhamnosyltransferase
MDKAAAVVILFNPNKNLQRNVLSYLNDVSFLYLVDNSETSSFSTEVLAAYKYKILTIHNASNEGIAKRLNQACRLALKDGFNYLLTMDQDSFFDERMMKEYFKCIQSYPLKEKVAMFGVNYEERTSNLTCNYNKVKVLITSGSVINLNNYEDINGFDENLFIDYVDTDYCFKSILKGYELVQFSNIYMHHEIGTATQYLSIKNLKSSKRSIHSSTRLYYMTRNFLYLKKKYEKNFEKEISAHKKDLLNRIKNKLLYNSNRLQTLKMLIKAYVDYKKNRMGKQIN